MTARANRDSATAQVTLRRHGTEWRAAAVMAVAFSVAYAVSALFRHWHFATSYDLAIFDQAIWHLSRLETPVSTVGGYANIFGDHFHPILLLLVPFYRLAPAPETLLVAQAVLLGGSIIPVYAFLRDRLSHGQSLALSAAYGSFWGMQRTAAFDFHELAFAPLLVALAILAIDRRRWGLLWILSVALCLVKEDMIPLVSGIGLYLMFLGERRRGVLLFAGSLVTFAAVLFVVLPWMRSGASWAYGSAFTAVLERPWTLPLQLVTPIEKLRTVAFWLAPFSFLPLLSPLGGLLVPVALERLLSSSPHHWGHGGHYSAPLAPILAMAAGDALRRVTMRVRDVRTRRRVVGGLLGFALLTSLLLPGHQPLLRNFAPKHYRPIPTHDAGARALSFIPPDASVVAQAHLAPHLTHRELIYLLQPGAPDADFVIASAHLPPWPLSSTAEMLALIDARKDQGYTVAFDADGWVVLRR